MNTKTEQQQRACDSSYVTWSDDLACRCVYLSVHKHRMHIFTHICESVSYTSINIHSQHEYVFILLKRVRRCVYVCVVKQKGGRASRRSSVKCSSVQTQICFDWQSKRVKREIRSIQVTWGGRGKKHDNIAAMFQHITLTYSTENLNMPCVTQQDKKIKKSHYFLMHKIINT